MKGFFPYANASFGYRFDPFNPGTDDQGFAMSGSLIADQGFPPNYKKVPSGNISPKLAGGVNVGIGFSDRLSVNANADLGMRLYKRAGYNHRRVEVDSVRVMGSAGYAGYLDEGLGDLPFVVGGAVSLINSRPYWVDNRFTAALKLGEVGVTGRFLTTLPESDEPLSMVDLSLTFGRPFY